MIHWLSSLGGDVEETTGAGGVTAQAEGRGGETGPRRGSPQTGGEAEGRGGEEAKGRVPPQTGTLLNTYLGSFEMVWKVIGQVEFGTAL